MIEFTRLVDRVATYLLALVLVCLPGAYLLYLNGYPLSRIWHLAELFETLDLATRTGDVPWTGIVGALWVMLSPIMALVVRAPVGGFSRRLADVARKRKPSFDFKIEPKSAITQDRAAPKVARLTKSMALRPFEENLRRGRPKDVARAMLAWYAAWSSMRDILETARLAHDAELLVARAGNWEALAEWVDATRLGEARAAMEEALGIARDQPAPEARPDPVPAEAVLGPIDETYFTNLSDDPFVDDGRDLGLDDPLVETAPAEMPDRIVPDLDDELGDVVARAAIDAIDAAGDEETPAQITAPTSRADRSTPRPPQSPGDDVFSTALDDVPVDELDLGDFDPTAEGQPTFTIAVGRRGASGDASGTLASGDAPDFDLDATTEPKAIAPVDAVFADASEEDDVFSESGEKGVTDTPGEKSREEPREEPGEEATRRGDRPSEDETEASGLAPEELEAVSSAVDLGEAIDIEEDPFGPPPSDADSEKTRVDKAARFLEAESGPIFATSGRDGKREADIPALLDALEAIDVEAASIVMERDAGLQPTLVPLVDRLLDLGAHVVVLDQMARGRLAAALREPAKAPLRGWRELSTRLLECDEAERLVLVEEELRKVEPAGSTDDQEEDDDDF